MKLLIFLASFLSFGILPYSYAQNNLYMPRNIEQLYNDSTRSFDGKPGKNYWQNFSDYFINAEFNPLNNELSGSEKIIYHNNSPIDLKTIVIRLYQDVYKKGNVRDMYINPEDVTDGVELLKLKINNIDYPANENSDSLLRIGTNLIIQLSNPIKSDSAASLEIDWKFKVPEKTLRRMGTVDSTSFFIAYWYPQISVFDDVDGWDLNNYTGSYEFYNDFNNFQVEFTLPKNYLIWGTGKLLNAEDIFSPDIYSKYLLSQTSDSIIHVVTQQEIEEERLTKDSKKLKWKFKTQNIPDIAYGISNHYLWDAKSVVVDSTSGRRVSINAAYPKDAPDFDNAAEIAGETIKYYSFTLPGVPFPYEKMTVFNGLHGGGMEFPMIVNDVAADSSKSISDQRLRTVGLTSHEIGHNYFPFYMGINERKYAWMDEGMASFLSYNFTTNYLPESSPINRNTSFYQRIAGTEMEMPLMVPSLLLRGISYRVASYQRSSAAYLLLRELLGENLFDKAYREYIKRWNGKHPIPYDFFFTFNNVSNKNLNWFWNSWFFESGYPDLAISSVKLNAGNLEVLIKKIGRIPVPINLKLKFDDDSTETVYVSSEIWADGKENYKVVFPSSVLPKSIILWKESIPDSDMNNNEWIREDD